MGLTKRLPGHARFLRPHAHLVLVEVRSTHTFLLMRRRSILHILGTGDGGRVSLCAAAGGEAVADVLHGGGVEDVAVSPWGGC